jgi:PAS domain S-box-containing protein
MLQSHVGAQELEPGVDGWLSRLRPSRVRQTRQRADAAAILESLDPAVVGRGVDGVITTWNTGAERLYGYSAEEMIGQRFEIIVPSARRRWEAEAVKASLLARLSDTYDTDRPE